MDPLVALRIIGDSDMLMEDREEACQNLKRWLAFGGFDPRTDSALERSGAVPVDSAWATFQAWLTLGVIVD